MRVDLNQTRRIPGKWAVPGANARGRGPRRGRAGYGRGPPDGEKAPRRRPRHYHRRCHPAKFSRPWKWRCRPSAATDADGGAPGQVVRCRHRLPGWHCRPRRRWGGQAARRLSRAPGRWQRVRHRCGRKSPGPEGAGPESPHVPSVHQVEALVLIAILYDLNDFSLEILSHPALSRVLALGPIRQRILERSRHLDFGGSGGSLVTAGWRILRECLRGRRGLGNLYAWRGRRSLIRADSDKDFYTRTDL